MTPFEEMALLRKEIAASHKELGLLYQRMSRFGSEFQWRSIEAIIEGEKAKAAALREKLKDASHRFVNWKKE